MCRDLELIKSKLNAELVYENWQHINDVRIIFHSFENYFFRNNSYAGLSLLITESNLIQIIDVVAFGGGGGPFNLSWGANIYYLQTVVHLLKEKRKRV